jgi:hypothetical protein
VGSIKELKMHFSGYRRLERQHQNGYCSHIQSDVRDIHGSSLWSTPLLYHRNSLWPETSTLVTLFQMRNIVKYFCSISTLYPAHDFKWGNVGGGVETSM